MDQPPSSPLLNPQQIQQFLSTILSQRGPSSLPYTEDTKWLIRQQIISLTTHHQSLQPKSATFTHNDGRSVDLLQLDGTIPMPFQCVTYNIPVIIWLIESYPRYPPVVYVNPTRNMIIKRPHPYVSPSGLVSITYLQNWVYPSSNLFDLVHNLSSAFSHDPPLYSQRSNRRQQQPVSAAVASSVYPSSSYGRVHSLPQKKTDSAAYPSLSYGRVHSLPQKKTDSAAEVYKRNAINKLVEIVHGDIIGMRKEREDEMEGLFTAQAVLRRREEEINTGLRQLRDEKEGLEQQLQVVSMSTDLLNGWVRENEGKTKNDDNVDVDKALHCVDVLSEQMLDCTAGDLAIEDVVYALDKAVQEGAVPFDQYLRNVRLLSREQFFHKATAAKVRAAQMQARVTAARVPHSRYDS